jgi:hypothetical protein
LAREDALRTFEQRRDAYVGFYETLRTTVRAVYVHGMGLGGPPAEQDEGELLFEWNQEVARKLEHLRIYDAMRRDLGLVGVLEDGRPLPGSGWVAPRHRPARLLPRRRPPTQQVDGRFPPLAMPIRPFGGQF